MAPSAEPPPRDDLSLTTITRIAGTSITSSSGSVVAVSAMNGGGGATARWLLFLVLFSCDRTHQAWGLQGFWDRHPGVTLQVFPVHYRLRDHAVTAVGRRKCTAGNPSVGSPSFGLGIGRCLFTFFECASQRTDSKLPRPPVSPPVYPTGDKTSVTNGNCRDGTGIDTIK